MGMRGGGKDEGGMVKDETGRREGGRMKRKKGTWTYDRSEKH
jgi:hypothetical protein